MGKSSADSGSAQRQRRIGRAIHAGQATAEARPSSWTSNPEHWLSLTTMALMVLTLIRAVVMVFPELYWDVDPRLAMSSHVIIGLGPAGTSVLDSLCVLVAAIALFVHGRLGGKLAWKTFVLALFGAGFCAWHMGQYVPGRVTLGAWIGAMALAIAVYHLAQYPSQRRIIFATFMAMIGPFLIRSVVYVFVEHAQTVQVFLSHEAQSVAALGWTLGSPQHLLYKRRIEFADVTGSFGLSNVFGSMIAAMSMLAATLTAATLYQKRYKLCILPGVLLVASWYVLYLTHSKGVIVTAVVGLGLLGVIALAGFSKRRRPRLGRWIAPMVMLCVVLAFGVVVVRGMMGPPATVQGERSLLFRAQYWQAAGSMLVHEPWPDKLLGVGAGRFKAAYARYKNPLNPEEVTSTHNIEIDLLAMNGLGGLAWVIVLGSWLWIAARATGRMIEQGGLAPANSNDSHAESELPEEIPGKLPGGVGDHYVGLAVGMAVVLFGVQFYYQGRTLLDPIKFLSEAVSVIAFIGVAAVLLDPRRVSPAIVQVALMLGAAVLVIHNQIEMTFFNMQACLVAYVMLGAAAGAGVKSHELEDVPEVEGRKEWGILTTGPLLAVVVLALGFGAMLVGYVAPAARQQVSLECAANLLQARQTSAAIAELQRAIKILPRDPRPYDNLAMLQLEGAAYFASQQEMAQTQVYVSQSLITLDDAFAAGLRDVSLLRRRAQVFERAGQMLDDPLRTATAINVWEHVLTQTPDGIQDTLHLAELLWQVGRRDEAARWYQRVLQLNKDYYLDPARQLHAEKFKKVQERSKAQTR